MLTTSQKGHVAETAVIHECAKLGVPVARPLDDQRYDLIFDLGATLLRVQCKEIDAIAAFCPETGRCYLLPHELSVGRSVVQLRLEPTKNNQAMGVRWADDYEFAARLSSFLGP